MNLLNRVDGRMACSFKRPVRRSFVNETRHEPLRKLSISHRLYAVSVLLIAGLTARAVNTWVQLSHVRERPTAPAR